uniref:Uncharacterized protein n=1 Tax=Glossina palpalis gambiensis TaxID=67801 RepID=A0A1B0AQW9_9MUSC
MISRQQTKYQNRFLAGMKTPFTIHKHDTPYINIKRICRNFAKKRLELDFFKKREGWERRGLPSTNPNSSIFKIATAEIKRGNNWKSQGIQSNASMWNCNWLLRKRASDRMVPHSQTIYSSTPQLVLFSEGSHDLGAKQSCALHCHSN